MMIKQDHNSFYIKDERAKLVARMEFSQTETISLLPRPLLMTLGGVKAWVDNYLMKS